MTLQSSNWIVPLTPSRESHYKLFCFPYAGSGASVYRSWGKLLHTQIQAFALQPPARESRFSEKPLSSLDEYATQAHDAIKPYADRGSKLIFFGHSLGSLAAYETAKRLNAAGTPLDLLIVSGRQDPTTASRRPPISHLADADFIRQMATYNGTPSAVLQNKELIEILLPMIRADFTMAEHYPRLPVTTPLECPVIALASHQDEFLSEAAIAGWQHVSNGSFETKWFDGDHFYLNHYTPELVGLVSNRILGLAKSS